MNNNMTPVDYRFKVICRKHADCSKLSCLHRIPHKEEMACDQGSCTQYSEGVECMQHKPIEFLGKDEFEI